MKDIIIGTHLWFARVGATVDEETVSAAAMPDPATTLAEWLKLGSVEQWEPRLEQTKVTRRAPKTGGGKYVDRKEFILGSSLTHAFGIQEFGVLEFELLANAAEVDSETGEYVPNTRTEGIEGWAHRKSYDQNGDLIDVSTAFVSVTMDSFQFAENLNPHTLMMKVIDNALNEGVIANLTPA
jgi:hypothetical protein